MTRRFMDMNAEQELAAYLDLAFYKPLLKQFPSATWERRSDTASQLKGVDGILTGKRVNVIDEKATLYYINRDIPTFAFEIDSYQRSGLIDGWLFNEEYETTHYLLIWPRATTTDLRTIKSSDFCKTLCYLVPRQSIIHYLAENGFTKERISADSIEIRKQNKYGKLPIDGISDFYYFLSSPEQYSESPLNIVIKRKVLEKLALLVYTTK